MVCDATVTLYDLRTGSPLDCDSTDPDPPALGSSSSDRPRVDEAQVQRAVRDLLAALGRDPSADGVRETPRRVAAAYAELLQPPRFDLTTFPNDERYDELVVVRDIGFNSLCEHHLLPFVGVAHVGYLPGPRILGLSKLAHVVDLFARDLQMQERMTAQIANWLEEQLRPKGVGVVLEADHSCMGVRGVRKAGAATVTSALRGALREGPSRQEFLALAGVRP